MFNVKMAGKVIACEHKEVLTDSQYEKLECKELQERIDALCKDMHVSRYIEENGNVKISVISRNLETFDDEALHDMEMTHTSFLSAVDKMEMPEDKTENASQNNNDGNATENCLDAEETAILSKLLKDASDWGERATILFYGRPPGHDIGGTAYVKMPIETLCKVLSKALK